MKINHLGIATKGIDEALKFWRDALGLENVHTELVEEQKVRVAMLPIGETKIELLEATSDDSPIAKFIEKRGGGIHHIAVEVENIEAVAGGGSVAVDERHGERAAPGDLRRGGAGEGELIVLRAGGGATEFHG